MVSFLVRPLAAATVLVASASTTVVEGLLAVPPTPKASPVAAATRTALFYKNATAPNPDAPGAADAENAAAFALAGDEPQNQNAATTAAAPESAGLPGLEENDRFDCHPSVAMWRDFQNPKHGAGNGTYDARHNVREIGRIANRFWNEARPSGTGLFPFSPSPQASYFASHVARTAFFVANAILGTSAHRLSKRGRGTGGGDTGSQGSFLPMGIGNDLATRLILEAFLCYEQDYFDSIAKGAYREPWDTRTPGHRQTNPLFVADQMNRFARESIGTLGRRSRGTDRDKEVRFFQNGGSSKEGGTATSNIYPEYYQTAFHYQGDGWMSSDSASVYETSTETLFLGRQDSMQRTSLPPLVELSKRLPPAGAGASGGPLRVLEVACGTGRFLTFVRDNLPLDTECTGVDLSPFYLQKAADNDDYWVRTRRAEEDRKQRRSSGSGAMIQPSTLVQARAEDLPFPDGSFDAVVCVYLFHELPREVRAAAAAEMARVVAPGGTVVFADSIQKGDRPALDGALGNFQEMNEPHYKDYIEDDLGGHFEAAGLVPETKVVRSSTKSLSFSKPGAFRAAL